SDPAKRLQLLSSVIDRSGAAPTKANPFVYLDALYMEILCSIPSELWPMTKRLFSYIIHAGEIVFDDDYLPRSLQTLKGIAILFGLPPHVIYGCLSKCYSTLRIPDWKVAHKKNLTFLHASFADFLKNPQRSGAFNVSSAADTKYDVASRLLDIWDKCGGDTGM